jgi:hypothetical protein
MLVYAFLINAPKQPNVANSNLLQMIHTLQPLTNDILAHQSYHFGKAGVMETTEVPTVSRGMGTPKAIHAIVCL